MRHLLFAPIASFLITGACASAPDPAPESVPAELRTAVPAVQRGWENGDVNALRPFYADNVVVEAAGERYSGWNDVRTRWLEPAFPVMSGFRSTDLVFDREGADIIERGRYSFTLTADGRMERASGAFAQRWQRQPDGSWKVVSLRVE